MKSYIKYLGVIDKYDNCHYIQLHEGANIITGRSSTGKSAIIEIFDYCTGNTDNTIPEGVITDNADLYFLVLEAKEQQLILARKQEAKSTKAFYKIESEKIDIEHLDIKYFKEEYFINLNAFKIELGLFYGLNISDTDTCEQNDNFHHTKKKGRASFRNMMSFMLQHQNLIANKHSLFYRFDQKEKRERVIDEFKIFAGFVDQSYYIISHEIEELKQKIEKQKNKYNKYLQDKNERIQELDSLREQFHQVSGKALFSNINSNHLLEMPQQYLEKLDAIKIEIDEDSTVYEKDYKSYTEMKNHLLAERRKLTIKLSQIESSISYARHYVKIINQYNPVSEALKGEPRCPFCHQKVSTTENEVNKLVIAINWLNDELRKSPKRLDSFLPQKEECIKLRSKIDKDISELDKKIHQLQEINNRLIKNKSLEEQSLKIKLQIENALEWAKNKMDEFDDCGFKSLDNKLNKLKSLLLTNYDVTGKLKEAESFINIAMNDIGKNLDFEESYRPINLHFDIQTFELFHLKEDGHRVYLRSMGSGANWLYSHICLFMALLKFIVSRGDKACIPTILFLDQPSQVYFPVTIDVNENKFDAVDLKRKENKEKKEADQDLQSVRNLFYQILESIDVMKRLYGFVPQIIISDHADHLDLEKYDFNSYVVTRWRKKEEGFIDLNRIKESRERTLNEEQN